MLIHIVTQIRADAIRFPINLKIFKKSNATKIKY